MQISITLQGVTPEAVDGRTWLCLYHNKYTGGFTEKVDDVPVARRFSEEEAEKLFERWFDRKLNKEYKDS